MPPRSASSPTRLTTTVSADALTDDQIRSVMADDDSFVRAACEMVLYGTVSDPTWAALPVAKYNHVTSLEDASLRRHIAAAWNARIRPPAVVS